MRLRELSFTEQERLLIQGLLDRRRANGLENLPFYTKIPLL